MSRLKSARGASAGGGGRASSSATRAAGGGGARGVYVAAPKSDIFVALLGIALGAILVGCLLLALVWSRYDFKKSGPGTGWQAPASSQLVAFSDPAAPLLTIGA